MKASERVADLLEISRVEIVHDYEEECLAVRSLSGIRVLIPVGDLHGDIEQDYWLHFLSAIRELVTA